MAGDLVPADRNASAGHERLADRLAEVLTAAALPVAEAQPRVPVTAPSQEQIVIDIDAGRETPGNGPSRGPGPQVPYIATWSEEHLLHSAVVDCGVGIGYVDETLADRDQYGVLWQRRLSQPGLGQPLFGQVHPVRQRRAMRRLLCSICAGPPDITEAGLLWLIRDYRDDWPGWPEGMGVTEPPVCLSCARYSARACPALRLGYVAVRVGHSTVAGVYGARYQAGYPRPVAVEDATVAFDDPAIRWTRAAQLVREITQCTIIDLVNQPPSDDPRPPIAAAVIVKDGRVLLVQRRVKEGSLSWQFPAGEVEPGESAGEAAVREAHEETGLTVAHKKILGERVHPATGRTMVYVACNAVEPDPGVVDHEELVDFAWSKRDQLAEYIPYGLFPAVQDYLDATLTA